MRTAMIVLVAALTVPSAGSRADDPPKAWVFTGWTQAVTVEVRSRVTGHLTRVAVREGDAVAKGDLLAEIDPREYQLDLDAARARLKMAEARLQVAKVKAASAKKLLEKKVISQDELDLETAAEAETEAALVVAKVEVQRAELTLSWTRVIAPSDGRVSLIQTTEGGLVTADRAHILTVVATEPLYVTFRVPEAILLQLRRDGLCEPGKLSVVVGFATDEGYPHAAELNLIDPEVDPRTGSVRFRATVPNPKGFLSPGMSARVRLTPSTRVGKAIRAAAARG
jgi:RND family efflux transporter MFP subunit